MASTSLAEVIRAAHRALSGSPEAALLPTLQLAATSVRALDLPARLRSGALSVSERERLWSLALEGYRHGPAHVWAPVILEMLAPALVLEVARYQPLWPVLSEEDIAQQLIAEALHAARSIPIWPEPRLTERRVVRRASKAMSRWFEREARVRALEVPLEEDPASGALESPKSADRPYPSPRAGQ